MNPANILRQSIAAARRALFFAALFSLLENLLILTLPIYMVQVFDRVLSTRSGDTLIFLTIFAVGALLALSLLDAARARLLVAVGAHIEDVLAPACVERSIANSLRGRRYRSEALRDLRELRSFANGQGMVALFDLPWTPVFLLVIFLLNPLLGTVALVATLFLLGVAVLNDLLTRRPLTDANRKFVEGMRELEANNRSAETIDALGMVPAILRRWLATQRAASRLQTLVGRRNGVILAVSKFCRFTVQVLVIGIGAWLAIAQELTGGGMFAALVLLTRALAPIDQAMAAWRQIVGARAAYARLRACFDEPPLRRRGMTLPSPRGALSVENAGFLASDGRPVLSNISFEIEPGETLAIVGPSAAGKSTLARLIVGVYPPSSGHVRLDGADIHAWNRDHVGRYVGYLAQEVTLFSATVAENIARLSDAEPADIVDAARRADVHQMILRLPEGYDTEIGDGGIPLSGGQRQRLALARAIFGNPSLVVLDEPNANLDLDGDAALMRAIEQLKRRETTIVFITHRPGLLALADKLLVLRAGEMESFGPREAMLSQLEPALAGAESPEAAGAASLAKARPLRQVGGVRR